MVVAQGLVEDIDGVIRRAAAGRSPPGNDAREPDATVWKRLVVNTVKWIPGIEWLL